MEAMNGGDTQDDQLQHHRSRFCVTTTKNASSFPSAERTYASRRTVIGLKSYHNVDSKLHAIPQVKLTTSSMQVKQRNKLCSLLLSYKDVHQKVG